MLAVGALVGALLAATGLLEPRSDALPPGVIATVNGSPIYEAQFRAYVDTLRQDRRNALDSRELDQVLTRMIEERLLIQRGLDMGLAESEAAIRKAIVDTMAEGLLADVSSRPPAEADLLAFFAENSAYFTSPDLLQIRRMVFSGERARQRAAQAHDALSTDSFSATKAAFADPDVLSLPASPVPLNRLQTYLGPSQSRTASALTAGEYSEILADGERWIILYCVNRQAAPAPEFAAVKTQVISEYRRRQEESHLRQFLNELRAEADIRTNQTLLTPR